MKKHYILSLIFIISGCFLIFFGGYELNAIYDQPHFTGLCTKPEYWTGTGCPEEATEIDNKYASSIDGRAETFWRIAIVAGIVMVPVGLFLGVYRLVKERRRTAKQSKKN